MTAIELLDGLISDMKDYLDDYRYTRDTSVSRIEQYNMNIRIEELKVWLNVLRTIRSEQE